VAFDCRQSWVFPAGDAGGWYILPLDDSPNWLTGRVAGGTLTAVYQHRPSASAPGFAVYYRPANGDAAGITTFEGTNVQLPDGGSTTLPIAAGPLLSLRGYHQAQGEWWTLWMVQSAAAEPLSLLAHLYQAGSAMPVVADGLGYTADQWQPGDQFIQRHMFPGAGDLAGATYLESYLETGVYNYLTQVAAGPRLRLFADSG
jgi:hypothetical protein